MADTDIPDWAREETPPHPAPVPEWAAMAQPAPAMPQETPLRPWGDVAADFFRNLPGGAYEGVKNAITAVMPWNLPQTAQNVGNVAGSFLAQTADPELIAAGGMQRLVNPGSAAANELANTAYKESVKAPAAAVVQHFGRYGSLPGIQEALANDPFGTLMDVSLPFSLGGGGAMQAGRFLDPIYTAGKVVGKGAELAGQGTAKLFGGTTGSTGRTVGLASEGAYEGGDKARTFWENFTGKVNPEIAVNKARDALNQIYAERGEQYRAGAAEFKDDARVIPFDDVRKGIDSAEEIGVFRGLSGTSPPVVVEREAKATVDKIKGLVDAWEHLDPNEYHTPIGIDALKRSIGDLRDATDDRTPARAAADRAYNVVRDQLVKHAPGYSGVMEAYQQASDNIKELTKALSLGDKAAKDTALRKLLSVTRNNVNTNYGARQRLVDELAQRDPTIPYALAGQNLNTWAPRGPFAKLAGVGGLISGGQHLMQHGFDPNMLYALPAIPAFMPKVVGGAAYGGGATARGLNAIGVNGPNVGNALRLGYRGGQADEMLDPSVLDRLLPFSLGGR